MLGSRGAVWGHLHHAAARGRAHRIGLAGPIIIVNAAKLKKALKMSARSCFEEAVWGSAALLWEPWGDFVGLLTISGFVSGVCGSLSRSMAVFFLAQGICL